MENSKLRNKQVVERAREAFASRRSRSSSFRKAQLSNLLKFIEENSENMLEVLKEDMRKPRHDSLISEINYLKIDIKKMLGRFEKYMADEKMPFNLMAPLDHAYVQSEPVGVVLIIGPWNYPFLLLLQPLIGAIAAGNAAILKPSEMTPCTAKLIFDKLPEYLDQECYSVVLGGVEETKDLLTYKFDHIFFTGSTNVGRSVYAAAAAQLTPCTLELGGKSPCYIDESADFVIAAKRILWGKFVNAGQTCIAPDYLLCNKKAEVEFIKTAKKVLKEWYGDNLQVSPDLPRIVNKAHFERLQKLIKSTNGEIVVGGKTEAADLWIEPTIVVDVRDNDAVMQEEIFGPILPILTVNSVDEAIELILKRPKPLALYSFSLKESENEKLISHITSGGVCINDCLWQNVWEGLPFGGVGESGMGRHHGKYSFDTFSHKKAILRRGFGPVSEKLTDFRYPPYDSFKMSLSNLILRNFHHFNIPPGIISNILCVIVGALGMWLYYLILSI